MDPRILPDKYRLSFALQRLVLLTPSYTLGCAKYRPNMLNCCSGLQPPEKALVLRRRPKFVGRYLE
jgi:hypothetical protein